ncbi:hypothetical protein EGY05_14150 [Chryseobacterium arthrosphaerae]|uniref:Uncharacterized protein n=1 Tax=Chryseobacterium arthrosphaerae TaxID=651561 RepID=A0A1B8ZSL8_9FLAO|nr:hypothetical protein EGY05_14150 [Chryseobacterium arthrosphaerae]OCA74573.1 hypothetical protein BBI00_09625 [Chryseobacterium arthrosphaerae]RTZ46138.1 hypothetical protein EJ377_16885 [Chryseobacterium arthrosphaerae]
MNDIEKEFLIRNKIDPDSCVDLNGNRMTKAVKYWMELKEKKFAYNTHPCNRNLQHTIKKTRII